MEYLWPGIVAAQAIYVAAKLRIPDLLASGPKTVAGLRQIAALTRHRSSVYCAHSARSNCSNAQPTIRFRNTPITECCALLTRSRSERAPCSAAAFLWRPLGELEYSVRTGEPSLIGSSGSVSSTTSGGMRRTPQSSMLP